MNGKCISIVDEASEINGGWGEWSIWSECNRECNGGIQFTYRECDNPRPTNNGKYCLGERKRYRVCNTEVNQAMLIDLVSFFFILLIILTNK